MVNGLVRVELFYCRPIKFDQHDLVELCIAESMSPISLNEFELAECGLI